MISGINSALGGAQDLAVMRKQMFQKLDQNGDGKITKDEMTSARPQNGRGPSADDVFAKVDTNQDGSIDETEHEAFLSQMPSGPPRGGPGGPGGPRGPGAPSVSEMAESMFRKADTDNDGRITKTDLTSVLARNGSEPDNMDGIWNATDTDGDGYVTQAEMEAAMTKREEEMQARFSEFASGNVPNNSQALLQTLQKSTGYDKAGGIKSQLLQSLLSTVA